ncbi:aminoacyl-tRNA hydrolase [Desulfonatronum thioautotrophicum]|uniref:aminoacyl-tRNA hydrolase n=1 Tax=Desulfonatronum thioautotrophicum TaxID=617001 RepID=UPI0005EACFAE|nr:aminoacyl-tRNA hydrolase [Desulfonatronum thioautotrophicum]
MHSRAFRGLIVGLGNPGPEYLQTPHNMGFLAMDALFAASPERWHPMRAPVAKCELRRGDIAGAAWLALKPQTYMNRSGDAVGPLARWYRIPPEQILVVHDELDLQAGSLRFKIGGGAAGHKGLLSISQALGTTDFPRLRLGIGRPPSGHDPAAYVLRNFAAESKSELTEALATAVSAIRIFCEKGLADGMQELHSKQRKKSRTGQDQSLNLL